jgi:hypothetical protein
MHRNWSCAVRWSLSKKTASRCPAQAFSRPAVRENAGRDWLRSLAVVSVSGRSIALPWPCSSTLDSLMPTFLGTFAYRPRPSNVGVAFWE